MTGLVNLTTTIILIFFSRFTQCCHCHWPVNLTLTQAKWSIRVLAITTIAAAIRTLTQVKGSINLDTVVFEQNPHRVDLVLILI